MPLAQLAMMIEGGERQALDRKMPQLLERGGGLEPAGRHIGEDRLQLLWAHATRTSGSVRSR